MKKRKLIAVFMGAGLAASQLFSGVNNVVQADTAYVSDVEGTCEYESGEYRKKQSLIVEVVFIFYVMKKAHREDKDNPCAF